MRERDKTSHRELSSQAKINANFFNGTAAKSAPKSPQFEATTKTATKGQPQKVSREKSVNAYQQHEVSKTSEQTHLDSGQYEHEQSLDEDSNRLNLTSYLRHLKTSDRTEQDDENRRGLR